MHGRVLYLSAVRPKWPPSAVALRGGGSTPGDPRPKTRYPPADRCLPGTRLPGHPATRLPGYPWWPDPPGLPPWKVPTNWRVQFGGSNLGKLGVNWGTGLSRTPKKLFRGQNEPQNSRGRRRVARGPQIRCRRPKLLLGGSSTPRPGPGVRAGITPARHGVRPACCTAASELSRVLCIAQRPSERGRSPGPPSHLGPSPSQHPIRC